MSKFLFQKGHLTSEETRKKIGNANKGRVHSEETRKHMSEGRKRNEKDLTGEIYGH